MYVVCTVYKPIDYFNNNRLLIVKDYFNNLYSTIISWQLACLDGNKEKFLPIYSRTLYKTVTFSVNAAYRHKKERGLVVAAMRKRSLKSSNIEVG